MGNKSVEKVLNCFQSPKEFNASLLPTSAKVIIHSNDLEEIFNLTADNNWIDLRGEIEARVFADLMSRNIIDEKQLYNDIDELAGKVNRLVYRYCLKGVFSKVLQTEPVPIAEDISLIYMSDLLGEHRWTKFIHCMRDIYLAGYVPCGREGNSPNYLEVSGNWLIFPILDL